MPASRGVRWAPVVRVAGRSMAPTLAPGDLLAPWPRAGGARRGDLVVMARDGVRYVKRVAGVQGDVIELEAGQLRVNGTALDGRDPEPGALVARWTVPAGHLFVVGDNPQGSTDSRTWADPFVPTSDARRARRLAPAPAGHGRRTPRRVGVEHSRA